MKPVLLHLSVLGLMAAAGLAHPVSAQPLDQALTQNGSGNRQEGEQLLLQQIGLGETLYRDDIVDDAVRRLDRIQANHPQGILARLRIATRLERLDEAQLLQDRLERLAPDSEATRTGRVLIKLTTPEAIANLTQGRLYSAVGRVDEAMAIYDALLEGAYPTADLTLEYWQLYARQDGRRPQAIQHLQAALEKYPQHAAMLVATASMLFSEDRPDEARRYLRQLGALSTHRDIAANREYDYLFTLPVSLENRERWQDFVQTYAGQEAAARGKIELARFDAMLNDPAWQSGRQGVALVEQGEGPKALAGLQQAVAAYPDNVEFLGALGVAYLRSGNREQALSYFQLAKEKEPRVDRTYRWVSLIRSTEYWQLLEQASAAADAKNWRQAERLYRRAQSLQPDNAFALVGLGDVAMATGRDEAAWRYYRQAWRVDPGAGVAQRGVLRYLDSKTPEQALALLDELSGGRSAAFEQARRQYTVRMLTQQAEQAANEQRWEEAGAALRQAQQLDPDDPWLSYQLARSLREQGRAEDGLQAFQTHLNRHQGAPASHYAHGLLLAAADRPQEALDTLAVVPKASWDTRMHELEDRVVEAQLIAQAGVHREAGRNAAAIALLEQRPDSIRARLQVARWSYDDGDYAKALSNYNAVLRRDGEQFDARLGQLEVWLAQGKPEAVRTALLQSDFDFHDEPTSTHRRVAELWLGLGDPDRARGVLQNRVAAVNATSFEPEPLLYRDLARLTQASQPQQALDLYAQAMLDAKLLPAQAMQPLRDNAAPQRYRVVFLRDNAASLSEDVGVQRDNVAFTRAMRVEDSDGWLERGLRREAAALYQRQNPTITVHNDHWWRRDGTRGMSRLNANTTMVQLDYPIGRGKGFLRADHVRMDAGTLQADADGVYRGDFGSCSFAVPGAPGGAAPACSSGLTQRATGTSIALGWQDERLSFDLGTTPLGFEVSNWTGGISYAGKMGATGWRLTASRRPMSNTLLSFSGARDPSTGTKWGGVMATGGALTLSWDQGEANGVWADLSHHRLTGRNVDDNNRTRVMGGYYRRLINKNNETLSAGVNLMYWRYQKDLGDFTFGQGGYYSPRRYTSVSLPVSYARRTADWSFLLEGSVSRSSARGESASGGSRSSGTGYRVAGFAERRLSNHWVLGAGIDYRHSKDYSPSHFMLYLRYAFEPWQGDLPMAVNPMIPYAEFK